jgi:sulfotransferase famil protein
MPENPDQTTRPLFFLHIRKTAGCSVRNWLHNHFPARACLFECHQTANREVDPSNYQFVTGHVGFDYIDRFRARPICFVVLRDPLERALSAYHFFRCHDERYLQWLRETHPREEAEERARLTRRANELSLVEFLEREPELARLWLGNVQSRCLSGRADRLLVAEDEALVDAARNLALCEVVGITERLGASLERLARFMGWGDEAGLIPHDNCSTGRPRAGEIPSRARDILTDMNRADLELYRLATERFDSVKVQSCVGPRLLPSATDFTFDQPIPGAGWHPRERDAGGWFSWFGKEAWLDLAHDGGGDSLLELHVAHVLCPDHLSGLEVNVNGVRVAFRVRSTGAARVIEAAVPAAIVAANPDRARISLTFQKATRPCDLTPGNSDTRLLGVALKRVRLRPSCRAA